MMSVTQAYWVVLVFCLQMIAIKAIGIFSSHLKVRLQISDSLGDFKHLPFSKGQISRLQAPHRLLWPLLCAPKSKNLLEGGTDCQVWNIWMVCLNAGRQGNMAHPLQHVLLLWTLLPTLVLAGERAAPAQCIQVPGHRLLLLLWTAWRQLLPHNRSSCPCTTPQTPLPLFHSSIFPFIYFTNSTEDWSPGAALQVEAADRIVCIKEQTGKNSCFSLKEMAARHLLFLERSRLHRSLAWH